MENLSFIAIILGHQRIDWVIIILIFILFAFYTKQNNAYSGLATR